MVYEGILLFGIVVITGLLFGVLAEQRHALYMRHGLQAALLLAISVYFIWFWTHGGQTLAMKTWRMRLVTNDGQQVRQKRAIARYLLAWLWILPGLAAAWSLNAKNWMLVLIPGVNVLLWALTIYLDPQRQFLHDRIAGTRIVGVPELPLKAKQVK
jgi:uncharacterized RDD family membrane protein YckC